METNAGGGSQTSVFGISDLAAYAPQSVVSRTLVKKETGTITVFAFDQGQGLSTHSAPYDAFIHVVEGEAEITVGGQGHTVPAGSGIILPADVPHAVQAAKPFKMMLVMIRS